jgi:hypothetical protein
MVKFPSPRLTRTARERLAQFDEPAVMRRYLQLTAQCFAAADRMLKDGSPKRAARLDQRALALAILTNKPLRREDLIELDLASDFQRDSKGRIVGLSIPGSKTKPSVPIKMRHRAAGNLDLRARKDYLAHAHAADTD